MKDQVADVVARVSDAAFGRPLVTNVLRGFVVEAIVASALEPEWRWCGADYASWDFERDDGVRLEVKQSARRQSWPSTAGSIYRPVFDTRERTGYWQDGLWRACPGRAAHIYLLAYHDLIDESADHRDPTQWSFFVVNANVLPAVKRFGLATVRRLAIATPIDDLRLAVNLRADQMILNGGQL